MHKVIYYSFQACSDLGMNFSKEFLVGHELKLLLHKVCTQLILSTCLACSQMTKSTKKSSYLSHSQLMPSSFLSCQQIDNWPIKVDSAVLIRPVKCYILKWNPLRVFLSFRNLEKAFKATFVMISFFYQKCVLFVE